MQNDSLTNRKNCFICADCQKFSPIGQTFRADTMDYSGLYWSYQGAGFAIDIHDLFIKEDYLLKELPICQPDAALIVSFIITANAEFFDPYQELHSNSALFIDPKKTKERLLLHAHMPFRSVTISFSRELLNQQLQTYSSHTNQSFIIQTKSAIIKPLEKVAKDIYLCHYEGDSAQLFFEAKAKEALSIMIHHLNQPQATCISKNDQQAIANVARYIDHHYAYDIPQELLEQISLMSGTKLKQCFKKFYQMSITEYTQRKRIAVAEDLLLTTTLDIKDIAKSVGYQSASRFSVLYKRYKNITPLEIKTIRTITAPSICDLCRHNHHAISNQKQIKHKKS
ncbi:transcriptional regulator, AraC family [Granulicatella balaenopterae]|uniref:Transcriptional regulator, AraC family n=1 Tax=Granulicatella balaenopterae TaxID=137733 RepID=A0A1H9J2T1_9LACT|nr:AraC family transcriptional regulator [Granulicatella balaenopterae]SEQ81088.1 transcriptional regulator, AraC family [Granulicatella balaenopterae]